MNLILKKQKEKNSIKFNEVLEKTTKGLFVSILLIYCVSLIVPLAFMLFTSFKATAIEYLESPFGFPKAFSFSSYKAAIQNMYVEIPKNGMIVYYNIFDMAKISIIWSTVGAFFNTLVTTIVAYVITKYKFFGRNFLFSLGIVLMIVPIVGSLPAAMQLRKALNVYDNIALLILTGPALSFSGLTFLIISAAFKSIPWSYAEAVFIDGGGHYTVLLRIMLPMILPTSAVFFILDFLGRWNDYATFMIWLPSYPNLALGMYYYQLLSSQYMSSMPQIMAGFVIVVIPTVILYIFAQKLIMQRFNVGGLKG